MIITMTGDYKKRAWERIKAARDAAETAGFTYMAKTFDADPRSVQRITVAVQAANAAIAAGSPFSINWKTADNSVLTMNAQQMLGVPAALAQHADAQHQKAASLLAKIEAATTANAIDLVVW